jgi:dTDP-glucose 4,6-dehydratase
MILNANEGKPLPIYGDGGNIRDWLYVEDHCRGILRILDEGSPGEKYNLGGDCEKTNLEIVDLICDTLEEFHPASENKALLSSGAKEYRDLKTFVEDRPGHDQRYAIDHSKVTREIGWKPENDFGSGIRKTINWYLRNIDWCKEVQSKGYQRERLGLSVAESER